MGSKLKYQLDAFAPTEKEFDITEPARMMKTLEKLRPKTVVHCAAVTDVSFCEKNPMTAYMINSVGTYYLAELCEDLDIKLVYISTDHVFDGEKGMYKETDPPNPQGHYAKSKLMGEHYTLANDNLVIRTSFMDSFPFKKAYTDKYFSAEGVGTIASWIAHAVKKDLKGLWHIAGERKSIYDFAKTFKNDVQPMKLKDRPVNAFGLKYLKDTSLDCGRWENLTAPR